MQAQQSDQVVDVVEVSEVISLSETGDAICEYYGCSGDCDCHGDKK